MAYAEMGFTLASIEDAARLLWVVDTIDNETAVWRMHCAKKGTGVYSFVHDAMEDFWTELASGTYPIIGDSTLRFTNILEWDDVQKQYFQVSSQTAVAISASADILPVQCSIVVTQNADQPFGARRQSYQNRAFVGPVFEGAIDGEGKCTSDHLTQTLGQLEIFHDDLESIANASGVTFTDGLAVVSEKLEVANPTVLASAGSIVDTQRRRRRNLVEDRITTISF